MNAGLGTLVELKEHLLTASLRDATDYDSAILNLGKGVAARFENQCNRKFARVVGEVEIFPADRTKHVVRRYPLEVITKLEVQQVKQDAWSVLPDLVVNTLDDAGLVYFYGQQGWQRGMIRLTYTGGYWWNVQDADYTPPVTPTAEDPDLSVLPTGATALPDDLKFAWLLQCEYVWKVRDKLGMDIGTKGSGEVRDLSIATARLIPDVAEAIAPYIRYQMS